MLAHGFVDLFFFSVIFAWSIISFANLFYLQLGPYILDYSSITLTVFTLARALFGDYDTQLIQNRSHSMLNLAVFILYLFFAIFILLSIFLTILGARVPRVHMHLFARSAYAQM